MRTEKEILKDIINHINLHSMITWTNKLVDEANDLYKQQSGEQLNKAEVIKSVCDCRSSEYATFKGICAKCSLPVYK